MADALPICVHTSDGFLEAALRRKIQSDARFVVARAGDDPGLVLTTRTDTSAGKCKQLSAAGWGVIVLVTDVRADELEQYCGAGCVGLVAMSFGTSNLLDEVFAVGRQWMFRKANRLVDQSVLSVITVCGV